MSSVDFCPRCGTNVLGAFCSKCGIPQARGGSSLLDSNISLTDYSSGSSALSLSSSRQLAMWCHLAPILLGIFSVLLGFFGIGLVLGLFLWVPALIIRFQAKDDDFVIAHANESMNFQLFWLIINAVIFVTYLVIGTLTVGIGLVVGAVILLIFALPIGIFLLVSMIRGSTAASSGRSFKYPLVWFRIIR